MTGNWPAQEVHSDRNANGNEDGNGEAIMSKNRKSATGRLYYTFGTILLMAVITVCIMNFFQDSRLMNKPAVAASANGTANVPTASAKAPDSGDIKHTEE